MLSNFIVDWIFFSVIFYFFIPRQCECPVNQKKDEDDVPSIHYWEDVQLW